MIRVVGSDAPRCRLLADSEAIAWEATEEQRRKWRFIGSGPGIHWREIDADISVASLLRAA
jgi:Protein of unknown function (DUF2442)